MSWWDDPIVFLLCVLLGAGLVYLLLWGLIVLLIAVIVGLWIGALHGFLGALLDRFR